MNEDRYMATFFRQKVFAVAISLSLCQWGAIAQAQALLPAASDAVAAESTSSDATPFGSNNFSFHVGGFIRTWASFNLNNNPETPHNDKWKASMLRGSAEITLDARSGPIQWKLIARGDKEAKTGYLRDLQNLRATNGTGVGGESANIMNNYNNSEVREFWAAFNIGDNVSFRLGKQQIVWGESDFFHAMDVVEGYDMSWRLFFEPENEEWRKPLWIASSTIRVPAASGNLQVFVRPGLDSCKDIGNTYDFSGGRWFMQPYRGFDLTAVTNFDCKHPSGNYKHTTGGIRWSGTVDSIGYSFAYINTFSADPVANSAFVPYERRPTGALFDMIHPMINVFGATVNGYSAFLDTTLSAEVAYTRGQPYNVGIGPLSAPLIPGDIGLGLGGIVRKNTVTTMLRADKDLHFEKLLGTSRPSFSSIQLFDTTVLSYNRNRDDLVRLFAFASPLKEHNTILTAFTVLNYDNDKINPSFTVGTDLTNGGGFVIPAVDFAIRNNWRLRAEADYFWAKHQTTTLFDPNNPGTQIFGWFANSSQLVFRVTRQF